MHHHFNDEMLLSFLDGELPPDQQARVKEHLERCWRCRSSAADLEAQIHRCCSIFADVDLAVEGSARSVFESIQKRMPADRNPRVTSISRRLLVRATVFSAAGLAAIAAVSTAAFHGRSSFFHLAAGSAKVMDARITASRPTTLNTPRLAESSEALPSSHSAALPMSRSVKHVDPLELEVEVWFAIHKLGLDASDSSLQVSLHSQDVLVRGVVPSDEVRQQLKAALVGTAGHDQVHIEAKTVSEAAESARRASRVSTTQAIENSKSSQPPFEEELVRLAGNQKLLVFKGNETVARAEKMVDYSWALYRLYQQFQPSERSLLPPEQREMLHQMDADYLSGISSCLQGLKGELGFLLPATENVQPQVSSDIDAAILKSHVTAIRDLVEWLFAGRMIEAKPRDFAEAQQQLQGMLNSLDAGVNLQAANSSHH